MTTRTVLDLMKRIILMRRALVSKIETKRNLAGNESLEEMTLMRVAARQVKKGLQKEEMSKNNRVKHSNK